MTKIEKIEIELKLSKKKDIELLKEKEDKINKLTLENSNLKNKLFENEEKRSALITRLERMDYESQLKLKNEIDFSSKNENELHAKIKDLLDEVNCLLKMKVKQFKN